MRVLVVADPASDARLPGALQEAAEVADLFESFNRVYQSDVRASVVRLFGPTEANLVDVVAQLMDNFDILHYAGHCFFDAKNPPGSGWLFRNNPRQILSARELRRLKRIPHFVFSNACESGITPDRPEARQPMMVPSFAESFFEKGVSNFIGTAWPVDDNAARLFARHLYAGLLGLRLKSGTDMAVEGPATPMPLYEALKIARQQIADAPGGIQTWGAYQHYGNPYYRFFAEGIGRHVRPRYAEAQP